MQFDVNKYRSFFIAADTDSAIFSLEPLLIKEFGPNYKKEKTDNELLKLIERLDNNDNEYQAIISQPIYVGTDKDPSNIENKVQHEIKATMK